MDTGTKRGKRSDDPLEDTLGNVVTMGKLKLSKIYTFSGTPAAASTANGGAMSGDRFDSLTAAVTDLNARTDNVLDEFTF